jgi:polyphosphate kinase 2
MSRPTPTKGAQQDVAGISKQDYRETLHALQIELVKLQKHFIRCDDKILVLFEGRDAAGKDGVIKRVVQHLSPRETRVVALGKPSDRDRGSWYFQRYVPHLPAPQEFVLFNRSWYNRAGVERVMGFCTEAEYEEFMQTVLGFEQMLVKSGIKLLKYYLDITENEQRKRLKDRRKDPLKQWKISPIDAQAAKRWADYSRARNEMFARTHNPITPWTVVRADDKRTARLNLIKDLLSRLHYDDKDEAMLRTNPEIIFQYQEPYVQNGMIAS